MSGDARTVEQIDFDTIQVGAVYVTAARTVTESDIVSFAGLSGDYNSLHVDAVFAQASAHGSRIAHGLLVLSISSGLCTRLAFSEAIAPDIVGLLDLQCRWPAATHIGDTIRVKLTIRELKETSKADRGIVVMSRETMNQNDVVVMDSTWKLLLKRHLPV